MKNGLAGRDGKDKKMITGRKLQENLDENQTKPRVDRSENGENRSARCDSATQMTGETDGFSSLLFVWCVRFSVF